MIANFFPARFFRLTVAALILLTARFASGALFQISDGAEFNKIVDTNISVITTNATVTLGGSTILEGPVWVPGTPGYLIFSIFNNANQADPNAGLRKLVLPNTVTTYLTPPTSIGYNGSTLDQHERLISCQSSTAGLRIVMITNGTVVTSLASTCAGLKFYSPNDVVTKSDGTIWFTDPGFNGNTANPPQSGSQTGHWVYRFDPTNGNATCTIVISNSSIFHPNGLCFSPDESLLYLADYDAHTIRVYNVSSSNTLSGGSVFATIPSGSPDGIRCDANGRVYSSSGNGIYIYRPTGALIGRIITPNGVANLCFGGPDRRTLFISSAPNILSIHLKVIGAVWQKTLRLTPLEDSTLQITWPWPSTGFELQTSLIADSDDWLDVSDSPTVTNGWNMIQFPPTNSAALFRLNLPSP